MRRLGVAVAAVTFLLAACGGGGDDDVDTATFCDRLDRLTRNDPFGAFGDRATEADVEAAFEALVARAEELVEAAPPEARAAARDFEESAAALDEILAEVDYDGTKADPRAYREQQVAYIDASERLERYLTAEC